MGTDIHGHVEIRKECKWQYQGKAFHPRHPYQPTRVHDPFRSRDYLFFGCLAGVRRDRSACIMGIPRGYPPDMDEATQHRLFLEIVEEDPDPDGEFDLDRNYVGRRDAMRCLLDGGFYCNCTRVSENQITDPDLHTPSWVTLQELLAAPWPKHDYLLSHVEFGTVQMLKLLAGQHWPSIRPFWSRQLLGDKQAVGVLNDKLLDLGQPPLSDCRYIFAFDN